MNLKVIGGILIILGTSIGAGMLALPIASVQEGFVAGSLLLMATWMLMTLGAFFILEVNLWLPEDTNMISMAGLTLGKIGQIATWLSYLFLLYALLCAYISGNSDVLQGLLAAINIHIPRWLATVIIVLVFGTIIYLGIYTVDIVNRFLMGTKILIYILLVLAITPYIKIQQLAGIQSRVFISTIMVMITSFGFAVIVPSLRSYFKSDVKKLRCIILIGSFIPLVFYILWIAVVHGVIAHTELKLLAHTDKPISELTQQLNIHLAGRWFMGFVRIFFSICAATSFLGASLALSDFLADGFKIKKHSKKGILIYLVEFAPPLLIVLLAPGIFITALAYSGILCVILLMLLPALMVWSGRYHRKITAEYQVWGGKFILLFEIAVSILLLLAII